MIGPLLRDKLHRAFRELGHTANGQTSDLLDIVEDSLGANPIDMILHCPACLEQHIDTPEGAPEMQPDGSVHMEEYWSNPPHRSHLCRHCGFIWRPADVPTNGVAEIKTRGKNDSVLFDGPVDVMRWLRAQAEFERGQQLDPDWGA